MESTGRILRRSVHSFLKHFQVFSTTSALFLLPFSTSVLLSSEAILNPPSSSLLVLSSTSELLAGCHVNLSQQAMFVFVCLLISIAFRLSCFVMGKASIIQSLNLNQIHHKPSLFRPLILTQLCSSVTVNMVCFFLFNSGLNLVGSSSSSSSSSYVFMVLGRVVLCAFWANMVVISNLALVVAGMEGLTGFAAIYKACLLRKGNHSMALLVALPTNLGLAAIDGLFQLRVLQFYHSLGKSIVDVAFEGLLIAYLYSLLLVVDTIACCLFYKACCESSFVVADQSDPSCYDIENVPIGKI